MRLPAILGMYAVVACCASSWDSVAREITFEERVIAERAIARVYHSHRIGEPRPFEVAFPRSLLERKVLSYIERSVALERVWNTTITTEMLDAEIMRLSTRTRMPDRLRELFAALGDDRLLIRECLARPLLAGRLSRNFFAYDRSIHAETRRAAERLRLRVTDGDVGSSADHPDRTEHQVEIDSLPGETDLGVPGPLCEARDSFFFEVPWKQKEGKDGIGRFAARKKSWEEWWSEVRRGIGALEVSTTVVDSGFGDTPIAALIQSTGSCGSWDNGSLDDFPEGRLENSAVWTGSEMIIWGGAVSGGSGIRIDSGGRYDPATDTWTATSRMGAPSPRSGHSAVWTGSEMLVWGGHGVDLPTGLLDYLDDGARYDPVSDTWTPMSSVSAPSKRSGHVAIWTGLRMIVLGGSPISSQSPGGRYDPGTDSWLPVSQGGGLAYIGTDGAAAWTGIEILMWGGWNGGNGGVGARYDPAADTWTAISMLNAPDFSVFASGVWTGSRMIVWGGAIGGTVWVDNGGIYDPSTNTWSLISTVGAPGPRRHHRAVWTGQKMLVWGGSGTGDPGAVGSYDPLTDMWELKTTVNLPEIRQNFTAVWTGSQMVVWGGLPRMNTGGRYDPASDTWTPTATTSATDERTRHTAVWTGTEMIVWGGDPDQAPITAGRYDPATDDWTPTSTVGAPNNRLGNSAVWTGTEMIIWGGTYSGVGDVGNYTIGGGRYDPSSDTWTATSVTGTPPAREGHSTIWTGSEMIIWGGHTRNIDDTIVTTNTGGRYDPDADAWSPVATVGAPTKRTGHTAVWTGDRMIVWGGSAISAGTTGASYDPTANAWTPTSTLGAPDPRTAHTAVWSGNRMIVWGGGYPRNQTGGRYDPDMDAWEPTSLVDSPAPRDGHSAVWTGREMTIWGGFSGYARFDSGGRYDPVADLWIATSETNTPVARRDHTAIWTGSQMIVWGGDFLDSGGFYSAEPGDTSPGLVQNLSAEKAGGVVDLQWMPSPLADRYDVVRGSAQVLLATGDLAASFDSCLADDSPLPSTSDATLPSLGEAFWYLVRGENCAQPGSYDSGGAGQLGTRDLSLAAACP